MSPPQANAETVDPVVLEFESAVPLIVDTKYGGVAPANPPK